MGKNGKGRSAKEGYPPFERGTPKKREIRGHPPFEKRKRKGDTRLSKREKAKAWSLRGDVG